MQLARDALVVEADAIKYRDVVSEQLNRSLKRTGTSTADISKYVHEYSTKAAESLFVTAINQQRVRLQPIPCRALQLGHYTILKYVCRNGYLPADAVPQHAGLGCSAKGWLTLLSTEH